MIPPPGVRMATWRSTVDFLLEMGEEHHVQAALRRQQDPWGRLPD